MTVKLPRYRHFTVDPTKALGEDPERVWPSMAFVDDDEIDRLRELHAAERDAFKQRVEEQRDARLEAEQSDEPAPLPSELVDQPRASEPTPEPEAQQPPPEDRPSEAV